MAVKHTEAGLETKKKLYDTALSQFITKGYEKSTMRGIAKEAGVSPGLMYKYFDSKAEVIISFRDELTKALIHESKFIRQKKWTKAVLKTQEISLDVLRPHKELLTAINGIQLMDGDLNVFSKGNEELRNEVISCFYNAMKNTRLDVDEALMRAMARIFYMLHLGVVLFWLLDKSKDSKATDTLLKLVARLAGPFELFLKLKPTKNIVKSIDKMIGEAFFDE